MKRIEMRFLTEELLADISAICSQAANAAGAGGRDTHHARDVLDDGNREVVVSIIKRLAYECMSILYPFCKEPVRSVRADGDDDNRADEAEAYVVALSFPYERSETEAQRMKTLAHGYMTYKCAAEWLALTLPDTGQWQALEQKAQDMREQLTMTLVLPLRPRTARVRPRFY